MPEISVHQLLFRKVEIFCDYRIIKISINYFANGFENSLDNFGQHSVES